MLPPDLRTGLARILPPDRVHLDAVRTRVFALDASIYQPRARAVVDIESEDEVTALLGLLREHGAGVTFRG
ncbi:MAG TPA: hypothetical protein DGF30_07920, partial [Desulfomicrobium sp.]|nr:hypothetical protein [Desulfomicrobium sp.]